MRRVILLLSLTAGSLGAQSGSGSANTAVAVARGNWLSGHNNVLKTAEQLPDSLLAYRPTALVRSFGELFGHVAGAEYMFCAAVLGEPPRAEDAVEKAAKTKGALIQALKDAGTYCERAYVITDAASLGMTKLFGSDRSKLDVLVLNATHDWEHYGNLVTYLRLKGLVPPSSQ